MPRILSALVASLALTFTAAFVPSFAADSGALKVQNAWIRKPPAVDTAAAYFTLVNTGTKPVTVTGVTSSAADHAMIHETSMLEGQSRMRMRDSVVVEAGKTVTFAPEGLHVMLSGFGREIAVGEQVPLTLQLEGGGKVEVKALVRPLDAAVK